MPTIHANGIDIWYDYSLGSGPAIALNHGWRGATDRWPTSLYELRHIGRLLALRRARPGPHERAGRHRVVHDAAVRRRPARAAGRARDRAGAHRRRVAGRHDRGAVRLRLPGAHALARDLGQHGRATASTKARAANGSAQMQRNLGIMEALARQEGLAALAERVIAHGRENDPHYFEFPEPLDIARGARPRELHEHDARRRSSARRARSATGPTTPRASASCTCPC